MGESLAISDVASKNYFMRTLASKKKPITHFPPSHSSLVDTLYKTLESTYGKKIHKDRYSENSRRISLAVGLDNEQLTYALRGAATYKVSWDMLEKMDWIDRIGLFEGLARFEEETGDPRYFFVPKAHIERLTLEQILSKITCKTSIKEDIYETNPEDINADSSIDYMHIKKFKRSEKSSSDIITYFTENSWGLPKKEDIRNMHRANKHKAEEIIRHTAVEKRIMERLDSEGYVTFAEVELDTSYKHLKRIDVIGIRKNIKNIEVVFYDAKCATNLKTDFVDTADKLRETAEFMFYNFGIMPGLIIEKSYPSLPIPVEQPKVNPNYAAAFRL